MRDQYYAFMLVISYKISLTETTSRTNSIGFNNVVLITLSGVTFSRVVMYKKFNVFSLLLKGGF